MRLKEIIPQYARQNLSIRGEPEISLLSTYVLYINICLVMCILGQERQGRLIFLKEQFSVWCSLLKVSSMIYIGI